MIYPDYIAAKIAEMVGRGTLTPEELLEDISKLKKEKPEVFKIDPEIVVKEAEKYPEIQTAPLDLAAYNKGFEKINELVESGKLAENDFNIYTMLTAKETLKYAEDLQTPVEQPDDNPGTTEPAPGVQGPAGEPPQATNPTAAPESNSDAAAASEMAAKAVSQISADMAKNTAQVQTGSSGATKENTWAGTTNASAGTSPQPPAQPQQANENTSTSVDHLLAEIEEEIQDAATDHSARAIGSIVAVAVAAIEYLSEFFSDLVANGAGPDDIEAIGKQIAQSLESEVTGSEQGKEASLASWLIPAAAGAVVGGLGAGLLTHSIDRNAFEAKLQQIAPQLAQITTPQEKEIMYQLYLQGVQDGMAQAQQSQQAPTTEQQGG